MLTLFTIPRGFEGIHKARQENALESWVRLVPRPEIILYCDDPGVLEAAVKFKCTHVPGHRRHPNLGLPFVSDAFRCAVDFATADLMAFVNTDVMLMQDFVAAAQIVADRFDKFLVIGQRHYVTIDDSISFDDGWQRRLRDRVTQYGGLHRITGIDYMIGTRATFRDLVDGMPDFIIGRPAWDTWVVGRVEQLGISIVDATPDIYCVHQHEHVLWEREGSVYNRQLYDERGCLRGSVTTANWILRGGELKRKG